MRRRIWILSVVAASSAVIGVYTAASLVLPSQFVPASFVEARRQGGDIAEQIVLLSDTSLQNLEQIAEYDKAGKRKEALALISEELLRMEEMNTKALELSKRLEEMAESIGRIRPTQAKVVAAEAVSSEVALVSRLLGYNNLLTKLFQTLNIKVQFPNEVADNEVQDLIDEINAEVRAINASDKRFHQALAAFDALLEE